MRSWRRLQREKSSRAHRTISPGAALTASTIVRISSIVGASSPDAPMARIRMCFARSLSNAINSPERPANESQVGISRFQVRKKATRSQTAERSKIETAVGQRGVQYEIRSAPVCLDKQLPRRSRYAGTCWQKPSCRPCKAFLRNAFCP